MTTLQLSTVPHEEDFDDDNSYVPLEGDLSTAMEGASISLLPSHFTNLASAAASAVLPSAASAVPLASATASAAFPPTVSTVLSPAQISVPTDFLMHSNSLAQSSSLLASAQLAASARPAPIITFADTGVLVSRGTPFTTVSPVPHIVKLVRDPSRKLVAQIISNLTSSLTNYSILDVVPFELENYLQMVFKNTHPSDLNFRQLCQQWKLWSNASFCQMLDLAFPDTSYVAGVKTFLEKITSLPFTFDLFDLSIERDFDDLLDKICLEHPQRTPAEEMLAVEKLISRLPSDGVVNWRSRFTYVCDQLSLGSITTVEMWRLALINTLNHARASIADARAVGAVVTSSPHTRIPMGTRTSTPGNPSSKPFTIKKRPREPDETDQVSCTGCGRMNHDRAACRFGKSQFFNQDDSVPYVKSPAFRALNGKYPGLLHVPGRKDIEGYTAPTSTPPASSTASTKKSSSSSSSAKSGKPLSFTVSAINSLDYSTDYLTVTLLPLSDQQGKRQLKETPVQALLDTGSLAGDFIAHRIILNLNYVDHVIVSKSKTVCSGLDNTCYEISNTIPLRVSFFNEINLKIDTFDIIATVLKSSHIDLLIGRSTIKKYQLFSRLPSQLSLTPSVVASIAEPLNSELVNIPCGCQPKTDLLPVVSSPKRYPHLTQNESLTIAQTHGVLAALVLEAEELLGVPLLDEDDIDLASIDAFSHWNTESSENIPQTDVLSLIKISGTLEFQAQLRNLCYEFQSIFSNDLVSEAAKIEPFDMIVDDAKWKVSKNHSPPRPQSPAKQAEILRQTNILLANGIIEKSHSAFYSQVLMVPKPDGTSRMCIDYRNLNDCVVDASWPIPNIAEMLRRIGAQKPTIFGVMDLTQGYHQAPIAASTKPYTSFITYSGVYQYTRLPFGPKRAPSYFQEQMATTVLSGLIYSICEMYIDDCNVFANTEAEFLERLRAIFMRFKQHNMFLKASKCSFGFAEIDFVGKVLSEEGLKMSQAKIQSVLDFPLPIVSKQLKSFLGLVNYFRDFVRNQSSIVKPMHALIADYHPSSKLQWNSEARNAFQIVKTEISKCTTMHFLNDIDPITLHTDASDYGIGGYLYQTVDGKDHPIAFVSKSLNSSQLRWSVIQKEAYAIFHVCMHLESLLRDRLFTIRTDHRNLLFITQASNPMIVRWYMALSLYSFKIEFIAGVENSIADSMSRLCRNHMIDNPKEYSAEEIFVASIIPKFKLSPLIYKTISLVHNSKVGHFGLERTIKRLQATATPWEFMRQHVRSFIDNCPCCQKMSLLKTPLAAHSYTTSTYTPMECLNIDFIGPFSDKGYVLVIVDTCTRWVELYATTDASSSSAATCLLAHFGRFGAPHQLRSDQGPHFIADLIREFLSLIGTQHCLTLAYSKQENSIVERYNKEINRHIRALTYDNNSLEDYHLALPFVQRILNSNYSDRLKISSSQLLFGNILNLDRGLFLPRQEQPVSNKPLSAYISKLLRIQDNLLKASAKELLRTDLVHLSNSKLQEHHEFLPDSYVLVHYRSGAPPSRLHTHWRGPMRVVNGKNSRYTLYDLITHKEKIYHVTDMKPFTYDPTITDPLDVARRDYMEFFLEKILNHRGDLKRKNNLNFLVKWLGYDDSHNSWEPYSALRDSQQLHDYLIENNLNQLIPTKFTKK